MLAWDRVVSTEDSRSDSATLGWRTCVFLSSMLPVCAPLNQQPEPESGCNGQEGNGGAVADPHTRRQNECGWKPGPMNSQVHVMMVSRNQMISSTVWTPTLSGLPAWADGVRPRAAVPGRVWEL